MILESKKIGKWNYKTKGLYIPVLRFSIIKEMILRSFILHLLPIKYSIVRTITRLERLLIDMRFPLYRL